DEDSVATSLLGAEVSGDEESPAVVSAGDDDSDVVGVGVDDGVDASFLSLPHAANNKLTAARPATTGVRRI
ncbi:hypothetical protein D1871_02300, partial [Nakamurella silvestris]